MILHSKIGYISQKITMKIMNMHMYTVQPETKRAIPFYEHVKGTVLAVQYKPYLFSSKFYPTKNYSNFQENNPKSLDLAYQTDLPYSTFLAPCALNFFRMAANF